MNNGGWAVGWFTLTFINSSIAQSKNRSGILWWFISLFLGPIATVILAVIPAEPPRTTT
ncbi:MAG: antitermination protein NusB [Actinobacteria bacterium]|nr:antitermination protein NusB [Actinomycetota bacterium]MSX39035.1 antitermination protein NusB [Actinomycetota bacterium]